MFKCSINGVRVLFSKFFASSDVTAALEFVKGAEAKKVIFGDSPATKFKVELVKGLLEAGMEVRDYDHHYPEETKTERDQEIGSACDSVKNLLGDNAVIVTRATAPGCCQLLSGPVADQETVVIVDSDADGLLFAIKATGAPYGADEIDKDAAILDGPRAAQNRAAGLSELGDLLVKGMATLPPYDSDRPQVSEDAKAALFATFVSAAGGNTDAKTKLQGAVEAYEAGVAKAKELAGTAIEVTAGVFLVDTCSTKERYDLGTLAASLESRPGCRVTVVVKSLGPIAKAHGGAQYSLSVPKPLQKELSVQSLLPAGWDSAVEAGVICNSNFLLHVSKNVWETQVLPALREGRHLAGRA